MQTLSQLLTQLSLITFRNSSRRGVVLFLFASPASARSLAAEAVSFPAMRAARVIGHVAIVTFAVGGAVPFVGSRKIHRQEAQAKQVKLF